MPSATAGSVEGGASVGVAAGLDAGPAAGVPAVHHPLPFGPAPLTVLRLIDAAFEGNVVGLSVSEFDPGRDRDDLALGTLGWLIEWALLRWYGG